MSDNLKPTKEQIEDADKIMSIVTDTVKSFGHLGFAMGKETSEAIAQFLANRRTPDARLEAERAVIEAAKRLSNNGSAIKARQLRAALADLARTEKKP